VKAWLSWFGAATMEGEVTMPESAGDYELRDVMGTGGALLMRRPITVH